MTTQSMKRGLLLVGVLGLLLAGYVLLSPRSSRKPTGEEQLQAEQNEVPSPLTIDRRDSLGKGNREQPRANADSLQQVIPDKSLQSVRTFFVEYVAHRTNDKVNEAHDLATLFFADSEFSKEAFRHEFAQA